MKKIIIIDFNRTLYDPEKGKLLIGAKELLKNIKQKNYKVVLLSQAVPGRIKLIKKLAITEFFDEIVLTTNKSKKTLSDLAVKYSSSGTNVIVIGDRARREIEFAKKLGFFAIWLKRGMFSSEYSNLPECQPDRTVYSLSDIKF